MRKYTEPLVEVIQFQTEDILTGSGIETGMEPIYPVNPDLGTEPINRP